MDSDTPFKLENVISFKLDFENLTVFLDFLDKRSKKALNQINDILNRLQEFNIIQEDIKDIKLRLDTMNSRLDQMGSAQIYHSNKLMEIEKTSTEFENRLLPLEKMSEETKLTFIKIDSEIIAINKVNEDHSIKFEKIVENQINMQKQIETNNEQMEVQKKSLASFKEELNNFYLLEKDVKTFKEKVKGKLKNIKLQTTEQKNININFHSKMIEFEEKIEKLFEHINTLSVDIRLKNMVKQNYQDTGKTLSHDMTSSELINVEVMELKLKFENLLKDFDLLKKGYKTQQHQQQILDITGNGEKKEKNKTKIKTNEENIKSDEIGKLNLKINELNEQIALIKEKNLVYDYNIETKINRDELEHFKKQNIVDMEKSQSKIIETMKNADKNKTSSDNNSNSNSNTAFDKVELKNLVKEISKDVLNDEMNRNLSDNLLRNDVFKILSTKNDMNRDEIKKILNSMLEIKKISFESKEKLDKISEDDELDVLEKKVETLNKELDKLKSLYELNFSGLDQNDDENMGNIVKNLTNNNKILNERVEKILIAQDNFNSEIYSKVKKDLAIESSKILEDFRGDLKVSIGKIDDKLRDKVDRFKLDDFGKKMNSMINGEIDKKVDRNDLKRNNSYLHKKFDNLENKISKTLVDTLIDLQMEEAPLIVRKGILGDKCGSCNQSLLNNSDSIQLSNYQINVPGHPEENSRYKLRAIQDSSNKYKSGSYSRVLTYSNPETLPMELKTSYSKNFSSMTNNILPEIKKKSTVVTTPKRKGAGALSLSKIDEMNEQKYNSLINEELEKKHINPNVLLNAGNRIYETIVRKPPATNDS